MWFKVDDGLHDHPKTLEAGNAALGAWVRLGSWCAKHGTGGWLPRSTAMSICRSRRALATLIAVRMIDDHGSRLKLHDWDDYNPTAEEAKRRKLARSRAGAAGARARWSAHAGDGKSHGKPHSKPMRERCPVPVPVPVPIDQVSDPTDPRAVSADVRQVFDAWRSDTGHSRAKLDGKRARRIRARLAEGYSATDLTDAIRGRRGDPFLMGRNDACRTYDAISTLLRDAEQVERLMDLARNGPHLTPAQAQLRRAIKDAQ